MNDPTCHKCLHEHGTYGCLNPYCFCRTSLDEHDCIREDCFVRWEPHYGAYQEWWTCSVCNELMPTSLLQDIDTFLQKLYEGVWPARFPSGAETALLLGRLRKARE